MNKTTPTQAPAPWLVEDKTSLRRAPHKPFGVQWQIWWPATAGIAIALTVGAVFAWHALTAGSKQFRPHDVRPASETWTEIETKNVDALDLSALPGVDPRTGTVGPSLLVAPATGLYSVPFRADGIPGHVRTAYDGAMRSLQRYYSARRNPENNEPLPNVGDILGPALQRAIQQGNGAPEHSSVIRYNEALAYFWAEMNPQAQSLLEQIDCAGAPTAELAMMDRDHANMARRDGLAIACQRLQGYLIFADDPAAAKQHFWQALKIALRAQTYPGYDSTSNIFALQPAIHMLDISTSELWEDYFAAAVAMKKPPLDMSERDPNKIDSSILGLYSDHDAIAGHQQLIAFMKLAAVRQGEPTLANKLLMPPADGQNPTDSNASTLARIADVLAGKEQSIPPPTTDSHLNDVLQDWNVHNCERELLQTGHANCGELTSDLASWDAVWRQQIADKLQTDGAPRSAVRDGLVYAAKIIFAVLAAAAAAIGFITSLFRRREYDEYFSSWHYAESQQKARQT